MINYPNNKKNFNKFKSFANRGMKLEEMINSTNEYYLENNIAVIHKKPTPIQVVKIDNAGKSGKIIDAYFKSPSTTDYNGIYRSRYIDFEAKETNNKTSFPLSNLSEHQIKHLRAVKEHGGIAFIILSFNHFDEFYLLDADMVVEFYYSSKKKSIPYDIIKEKGHVIRKGYFNKLEYLEVVDKVYL